MPILERFEHYYHGDPSPHHPADLSPKVKPDIFHRLEQAVGEIQDSETFRRYLDMQARFHRYSFGNVVLILMQRPDATRVAGYNTWLKLHRYVRRGEHGINIIVPMRRKGSEEASGEDPDDQSRIFFGTGTVFDVAQTEGEELPDIEVPELHGDFHEGQELFKSLRALATRSGVSVRVATEDLGEGTMGYYAPSQKEIVLRPAEPLQMVKTLAHEVAHHQLAEHFRRDDAAFSTGERESIAESCAFVVCSHFGLDTGARSFPYIALWSKDKQVLKNVLTTVQKIACGIIDGVEEGRNLEEDEPFRSELQESQLPSEQQPFVDGLNKPELLPTDGDNEPHHCPRCSKLASVIQALEERMLVGAQTILHLDQMQKELVKQPGYTHSLEALSTTEEIARMSREIKLLRGVLQDVLHVMEPGSVREERYAKSSSKAFAEPWLQEEPPKPTE